MRGSVSGARRAARRPPRLGRDDSTIRLWDAKTGKETARLEGHDGWVCALAVLPDGRLASGSTTAPSGSGTPKPARRRHGSKAMRLGSTRSPCCPTAASPRARTTAPSGSGTPKPAGDGPARRPCGGSGARAARWPPRLGLDSTIRLWDAKPEGDGPPRRPCVCALRAADGRLASGSADSTIRLWDAKTGRSRPGSKAMTDWVRALACCPTAASPRALTTAPSGSGTPKPPASEGQTWCASRSEVGLRRGFCLAFLGESGLRRAIRAAASIGSKSWIDAHPAS